jgi:hypothetical protein
MKILRILIAGLLVTIYSVFSLSNANAGQLSAAGATISWDDGTFYEPSLCTGYNFEYTASNKVLFADIEITNRFNDKIGSATFSGSKPSGKVSVQVCTGKDLTGTKVALVVKGSSVYGGSDDIVSAPISFLSRTASSTVTPAPTVTVTARPSPAPTVTITATPAPAATVYVTNPADQNLSALVASQKSQIALLNAKLKKICSAKPKPRGC